MRSHTHTLSLEKIDKNPERLIDTHAHHLSRTHDQYNSGINIPEDGTLRPGIDAVTHTHIIARKKLIRTQRG
jgi:hypothetical protein